ncbi:MAG: serine hydrolase [Bacteroidota bacterium]
MSKHTKTGVWLTLGAGLLIFPLLNWWLPTTISPSLDLVTETTPTDSLTSVDEYGLDRLEELSDEQWLPEVAVSAESSMRVATHVLDTVNWQEWSYYANGMRLLGNPGRLLPLHPGYNVQLLRPTGVPLVTFASNLGREVDFRESTYGPDLPTVSPNCTREEPLVMLVTEAEVAWLQQHTISVQQWYRELPTVLIYFGETLPKTLRQAPVPVLHLPDATATAQALAVQALFGAADLAMQDGEVLAATRLGHAPPEIAQIDRSQLDRIDRYVQRAIRKRAIPGCQVLVAKNGKIVYDKTFGYHTYKKEQAVRPTDVYDLASITKAAGTTLGLMRLYEQGEISFNARLRDYLDVYDRSGLKYLKLKYLLAHHTGLQSNLPIARWLRQPDLFTVEKHEDHLVALGKDVFLKNGVREEVLAEMPRVKIPRRGYFRYSDVNFLLLQQVIEAKSQQSLDDYLTQHFYEPLGLRRLQYRPGLRLPEQEIVPTERDQKWRKQLVHGEVHDESALLLGGVAGHAGLFGNARDVATVFQLLLNGGEYGERTFLNSKTIDRFTRRNGYNYRASGFDRLVGHSKSLRYYGASEATFGHTGFTGTCVWADPENDLVFVFLSNRIHPNKYNTKLQKLGLRERLHKIVYQSLGTFGEEV